MTKFWNGSRFRREDPSGFYESYFQRANHPSLALAFWIRYTVFCPRGRPGKACGELWAIYFNGETNRIDAVKEVVPISDCDFSRTHLDARIGSATLTDRGLHGRAASQSHVLQWTLDYAGREPPLLLLPEPFYERGFPKAKALVGSPSAVYNGTLTVDGETILIDGWRGSQNHNWGSKHTDRYAWGQVAGFDNAPDAFLECSTAQIKLGPVWSPRLTFAVLRDEGREIALNGLLPRAFIGLRYQNPPGGEKTCLNTKLASAEITVRRPGRSPRTLLTKHRAAFEILTDRADHGVPIVA